MLASWFKDNNIFEGYDKFIRCLLTDYILALDPDPDFDLQVIPGRMTLLITIFLVLINIFNTIQTNSPQVLN